MATNGRNQSTGSSGKGKKSAKQPAQKGRQAPSPEVRTAVGSGPSSSSAKKVSAGRKSGVDKTQLYIMGVAVVVIIAVIIFGFVLNNKNTAAQNEGYGSARATVATVADGVIEVSAPDTDADVLSLDVFEDPLCPFCGAFERQYGQQIAQAMDEGKLVVRYHMLTFLDGKAATPDFSTRAAGALMCVAQNVGSEPGVYSRFHDQLFSEDVQPVEDGDTDLTNDQLVEQLVTARAASAPAPSASATVESSGSAGASQTSEAAPASEDGFAAASDCILTGANAALVATEYAAASATLNAAIGTVSSPVVLTNGTPVDTDDVNWLTTLLTGASAS